MTRTRARTGTNGNEECGVIYRNCTYSCTHQSLSSFCSVWLFLLAGIIWLRLVAIIRMTDKLEVMNTLYGCSGADIYFVPCWQVVAGKTHALRYIGGVQMFLWHTVEEQISWGGNGLGEPRVAYEMNASVFTQLTDCHALLVMQVSAYFWARLFIFDISSLMIVSCFALSDLFSIALPT
jgi:hypothetical protein